MAEPLSAVWLPKCFSWLCFSVTAVLIVLVFYRIEIAVAAATMLYSMPACCTNCCVYKAEHKSSWRNRKLRNWNTAVAFSSSFIQGRSIYVHSHLSFKICTTTAKQPFWPSWLSQPMNCRSHGCLPGSSLTCGLCESFWIIPLSAESFWILNRPSGGLVLFEGRDIYQKYY